MKIKTILLTIPIILLMACNEDVRYSSNNDNNANLSEKSVQNDKYDVKFQEEEKKYFNILKNSPGDFQANYNMGRLYYNMGVKMVEVTDSVKYQKIINDPSVYEMPLNVFFYDLSFDDLEGKTFALFNRAVVYFEKAYEIDSTSEHLLTGLLGCYFLQGQLEKYERINQELEELKSLNE